MQEAPRGTYSNDADFDGARPLSVEAQLDAVEAQIKKSDLTEAEAKAIKKQLLSAMEAAENQGDYLRAYDLEQALEAKKIGNTPANAEPASEPAAVTDTTEPEDIDASNLLKLDSLAENPNQAVPFDQLSATEPPKSPEPAQPKPDVLKPGEKQTIDVTNWPKSEHPIEAQQLDAEMRRVIALLLDPKFNPLTPTNELKKLTRYIAAFEQSITGTADALRSSYTNWIDVQTFLEDTYLDQAHQVLEAAKRRAFEQYLQDLTTNRFPEIGQLETALKLPLPTAGEGKAIAGFIAKIELSRQDLQQIIENPRHPVRTELPDISGKILESLSELEEQAKAKLQELDVLWAQYNLMKVAHPTARPQEFAELVQAVTEARGVTKAKQAKTPMERLEAAIQAIENYQLPNLPTNGVSHQFAAEAIRSFNDGKRRFVDVAQGELRRLDKVASPDQVQNVSAIESGLADKDLMGVLKDIETSSTMDDEETRIAYERVVKDRLLELADEIEDLDTRKNFIDLVDSSLVLFELKVFASSTLSGKHLVVKSEDTLIEALDRSHAQRGALEANIAFNSNPLVGSGREGKTKKENPLLHEDEPSSVQVDNEQYSDEMGLIQKMVCVMYMLMKNKDMELNEYDKDGKVIGKFKNPYARTGTYKGNLSTKLAEYVSTIPQINVIDQKGDSHSVAIAAEFSKLPKKVQDIIVYFAILKASRDDLGNKASNYIMAAYGKSPKLGAPNGQAGAGFADAGYIARAIYKSSQASDDAEFTAVWSYVNPTELEEIFFDKPSEEEHNKGQIVPDRRRNIIRRKIALIKNYYDYMRMGWSEKAYPQIVYKPTRWDYDFPSVDNFTNRCDGLPPYDRKRGRDAFRELVAMAYSSPDIKIRLGHQSTYDDTRAAMAKFAAKLSEAFAYIGKPDVDKTYIEYHKFLYAATKFYVANLLMSVNTHVVGYWEDKFKQGTSMGNERINKDAEATHNRAVDAIRDSLDDYVSSIGHIYYNTIVNTSKAEWLKPEFFEMSRRINKFHTGRIRLDENLQKLDPRERENLYYEPPLRPFKAAPDKSKDQEH